MTKLTLPIEIGNRYVRRDGVVVTAIKPYAEFDGEAYVGTDLWPTSDPDAHVWIGTGRVSGTAYQYPHDLIADYVDTPVLDERNQSNEMQGEIDACWAWNVRCPVKYKPSDYATALQLIIDGKSLEFNQQLPQSDEPDWVDTSPARCLIDISTLTIDPKCWRTKVEPFIVNGVELTERPMTEVPPVGTVYWYVDLVGATMVESAEWQNYQFDIRALARGIAHHSEAGASAHANALLFNQKVKTDHVNTSN